MFPDLAAKAHQNNADLLLDRAGVSLYEYPTVLRLLAFPIVAPRQGYDEPGFPLLRNQPIFSDNADGLQDRDTDRAVLPASRPNLTTQKP
jgi:hypothetical protein